MPAEPSFEILPLELGPMANIVYLLADRATSRAAVVDPAWEPDTILQAAEQRGLRITDILLTHSHHDHVNAIEQVLERADAAIHLLKPEARFWGRRLARPVLHHGGDRILLGESEIEVLHTPGHTPGSACYRLGNQLLSGDTLFVYGCGRCDLAGGDPEQMYHTLKRLVAELPPETVVRPGHDYAVVESTTLEEQQRGNPFLHFHTPEEFVFYRMHYHGSHREEPYGPVPPGEEMPDRD